MSFTQLVNVEHILHNFYCTTYDNKSTLLQPAKCYFYKKGVAYFKIYEQNLEVQYDGALGCEGGGCNISLNNTVKICLEFGNQTEANSQNCLIVICLSL